jgi:hypothetical protein
MFVLLLIINYKSFPVKEIITGNLYIIFKGFKAEKFEQKYLLSKRSKISLAGLSLRFIAAARTAPAAAAAVYFFAAVQGLMRLNTITVVSG